MLHQTQVFSGLLFACNTLLNLSLVPYSLLPLLQHKLLLDPHFVLSHAFAAACYHMNLFGSISTLNIGFIVIFAMLLKAFLKRQTSVLTWFSAPRSHHSSYPAKMKTSAKAATRSPPSNSPLSRSTWMSLMVPAPRSHYRSMLSKQSPLMQSLPSQSAMPWHGSDSRWPPSIFHQRWMSALVSCKL